jgi:DNA-directed RNA polymerase, mitochondrial
MSPLRPTTECELRCCEHALQVKQTVMTSVYGVTFVGARQQISNRLKDKGWTHDNTIFRVSNYGARVRACCPLCTCAVGVRCVSTWQMPHMSSTDCTSTMQSSYLQVTLDSLMSMFSSAKDIMKWLTDCAAAIAGQDKSVHWVTPLGLPIIQPYR